MTIYRAICLILFISLQHSLFLSNNSLFTYFSLNKTLESSSEEVAGYQISNKKLRQEIKEIRKDKTFIEIYARENYGYIKKNEIFYQIIKNEK
ncbi:MAG: septum formation initiator family protein [Gammaproteobacteria bacterium]|jgi:cell division protein FtsB|nr:septum formation initiator family protein [Gammaproteobacteria bacterium]|tara:strand:+ start:81 stop:359 length:279 start_codon:yes stop_codon:yes gene_type:complete